MTDLDSLQFNSAHEIK